MRFTVSTHHARNERWCYADVEDGVNPRCAWGCELEATTTLRMVLAVSLSFEQDEWFTPGVRFVLTSGLGLDEPIAMGDATVVITT